MFGSAQPLRSRIGGRHRARFTNSFAGIVPPDVPTFIVVQLAGAIARDAVMRRFLLAGVPAPSLGSS